MATKLDHPLLQRPLYAFDLPEHIVQTLAYKPHRSTDQDILSGLESKPLPSRNERTADADDTSSTTSPPKSALACALCVLKFDDVIEQRRHNRSDLHCYNLKQKIKGLDPVSENEFEKLIGDLDESLSGSDSSSESSDGENESLSPRDAKKDTTLSALLKKQAKLVDGESSKLHTHATSRKQGPARDPIFWCASSHLPSNITLGFYRAIFPSGTLPDDPTALVKTLQQKQLVAKCAPSESRSRADRDGGVPLPESTVSNTSASGPHYFLCMTGGGHFAAMIVSLTPKVSKKNGFDDRSATVIAHKTFHRYTTRRKQGGSQSANDNAKGAAHSAGSSLRRYNETALTTEVRELLGQWKHWIESSELLFIRATGSTSRRTLYESHEGQVLHVNDERIRGFPFNTRRATQAELMRAFVELTRVKIHVVDEEAEARRAEELRLAAEKAAEKAAADAKIAAQCAEDTRIRKAQEARDQEATLHTSQIQALIKRSKAAALINYLTTNNLAADYAFFPPCASTNHIAPRPLHCAARMNSPACVTALLTKPSPPANPTLPNASGKLPIELASERATRDAFRVARHELGDTAVSFDWEQAKVGAPMTRAEADSLRAEEQSAKEKAEQERVAAEHAARQKEERESGAKSGGIGSNGLNAMKSTSLRSGLLEKGMSGQDRREEELRGLTPEMRMKLERERRARAVEARLGLR